MFSAFSKKYQSKYLLPKKGGEKCSVIHAQLKLRNKQTKKNVMLPASDEVILSVYFIYIFMFGLTVETFFFVCFLLFFF